MNRSLRLFLILLWFGYTIVGGIYLFSNGFLLSKIVQDDQANCTVLGPGAPGQFNSSERYCLEKRSKVIILLVDALKYEFGVYNSSLDEASALPFQNKLRIIHELRESAPSHTRLYKFVADPPTTTLQRLKGLTTGTLPTFIDVGSNFATPEINEDNIIDQLKGHGKKTVFMGDSTWTDLFPKRFLREYSYPSFNIFDLDSVDAEIQRILPEELEKSDWDLLVAHSLGVDHCGHKHGPFHPEMKRKLSEVDEMIRLIVDRMREDAVLFVIGDHGMTDKGDHGGESEDETNALLFAYSKGHPFHSIRETAGHDSMQQIDFVPVLSSILGVPVPFSNLGALNVNLIPSNPFLDWTKYQILLQNLWLNARQMQEYFESYAADHQTTFDEDTIDTLQNKFLVLSYRVGSIYTDGAFQNFERDCRTHLQNILGICREVWVKFDPLKMQQGLLIVIFSVILQFLIVSNLSAKQLDEMFSTKVVQLVYLLNTGAVALTYLSGTRESFWSGKFNFVLVTCLLSVVILALLTVQKWNGIVEKWSASKKVSNMLTRTLYGCYIGIFFSNSFIVQEQQIVTYLLVGIFCYCAYCLQKQFSYKQGHKWGHRMVFLAFLTAVVGSLFLLRMVHVYFQCREEQGSCTAGRDVPGLSSLLSRYLNLGSLCDKLDVTSIVSMAMFVTFFRIFLQSCGAFMGYTLPGILNKFGPSAMAICVGGHFVLANNKVAGSYPIQIDSMAWVVYLIFLIKIIVGVTTPLLTYLLPRKSDSEIQSTSGEQVIPEIFNKLKTLHQQTKDRQPSIPIVYGLPTAYSTAFISFLVFLAIQLSLMLGANAANGMFIAIAVGTALIVMQSIMHYNSSGSLDKLMNPTFLTLLTWSILAQFTFYATSHQPTLSQIDWHAAFVGRTYFHDHSNVVSGMLVLTNIFCGVIIAGLMCPLLIIMPFLIFVKYPEFKEMFRKNEQPREIKTKLNLKTGAAKKEESAPEFKIESLSQKDEDGDEMVDFDVTRGELNLYENERCLLGSGFRVAAKLIVLQGFRTFCSMLACTIHCRHLMVWKIFAPRFIYEGIATFIFIPALLLGFAALARVHGAVIVLIDHLTKPIARDVPKGGKEK